MPEGILQEQIAYYRARAPEMLAINQASVAQARVRYVCANVFEWTPDQDYDLVFFDLKGAECLSGSTPPLPPHLRHESRRGRRG